MRYTLRLLLILLAIAPPLLAWGYRIATTPVAELGELAEPIDTLIIKTAAEIEAEEAEWERIASLQPPPYELADDGAKCSTNLPNNSQ